MHRITRTRACSTKRRLRRWSRAKGRIIQNDHLPGASPGFQTAAKAAAALSRGRQPMDHLLSERGLLTAG